MGKNRNSNRLYFSWALKSLRTVACNQEIKRCLLLGRKAITHLGSMLKSRHITLQTKVHVVKAVVFPVVMYGCESWTIKKAVRWRIDAFELWCWRRPWATRRSNQSVLKEINPECPLEGLMLKLKLQLFSHLIQRAYSLEKTLMLGKIEGRRKGQQRMRWLNAIIDLNGAKFEQTPGDSEGQGRLLCCSPWGHKELDTTERLNKCVSLVISKSTFLHSAPRCLSQQIAPATAFFLFCQQGQHSSQFNRMEP